MALFVGLMVFLPSQMSIVDDFARRWTDIIWTSSAEYRATVEAAPGASAIYYTLLALTSSGRSSSPRSF